MSNFIQTLIQESQARREHDAKRWNHMKSNVCQVCGTEGNDRRTLLISCLYNLSEVSDQFIDLFNVNEKLQGMFGVRICKGCRAQLMIKLSEWINEGGRKADSHLDDDGIYSYSKEEWENRKKE